MATFDPCNASIEEAHARVKIASLSVSTPFVQSVTVSLERGTPQRRASCSLRVNEDDVAGINSSSAQGSKIEIWFHGTKIFDGVVRRIQIVPTNVCAGEFFMNVQAEDRLYLLENRKMTRRQKLEGLGPFAIISSKVDQPERGFDTPPELGGTANHSFFGRPLPSRQGNVKTLNPRELTNIIESHPGGTSGENHPVTKASRRLSENRGAVGGGALGIHDHSDLANLGPAHAVYGTK